MRAVVPLLALAGLAGCAVAVLPRPAAYLFGESFHALGGGHVAPKPPATARRRTHTAPAVEPAAPESAPQCPTECAGGRLDRLERAWQACVDDAPTAGDGTCDAPRDALRAGLAGCWSCCDAHDVHGDEADACMAARNRLHLVESFWREWEYKKTDRTHSFAHALAISGGGLRSAAFAIGVMSGLQEIGQFGGDAPIDLLSAVSGGSYAASWYLMQQYRCGDGTPSREVDLGSRVLDRCGPFEDRLVSHGKLQPEYRLAALAALNLLASPANLLLNGLLGWHANVAPGQLDYELRLADLFNSLPAAVCPDARRYWLLPPDVPLQRLGAFARRRHLPYLVINATAFIDDDRRHRGAQLQNSVYELALERQGSEGLGYYAPRDITVRRAVAISGAAADSTIAPGSSLKLLASALNQDLGVYVSNPRLEPGAVPREARASTDRPSLAERLARRVLPFPLYFLNRYQHDVNGFGIYLTDGGHAENSGAFAAVRRLPARLTIVDGEHDPLFAFESYFALKDALRSELGVELSVPRIDHPTPGRDTFHNPYPVMEGTIGSFWIRDADGVRRVQIPVKYIKLSYDLDRQSQYWGTWFDQYAQAHPLTDPKRPCRSFRYCAFPQESTFDLEFNEPQFRAYRDLGRWIVVHHYETADRKPTDPTPRLPTP